MSALRKLTVAEAKLFLREPMAVVFGVLFPTAILLGLGAVPALRQPSPEFGGVRFVELWAPSALVLGLGIVGLQHIPVAVAGYRERGILRRMSTTPVHPGTVLAAQLIVALAAAVVAAVLLIVSAWLVLDVPLPRRPVGFAAAFLLGFGAILAIGMLIAAVAPTARVANGLATVVYMVTMFAGGVFLPRFLLPDFLMRLGDYTPPGAQSLLVGWSGDAVAGAAGSAQLLRLGIMALIAVAAGGAAAKLFRWE
ncbi:ABC-2 type transport system permease protein [Micromonospora sp. Llam0]|uniref:ABC transporter permease n=1 Tax=Micromonospora sp. Llam0 TaxID=2485143 RepID=UPI000F48F9B0|nr:ABC transporter permease [Micromonospora sp. Llam0]ROO51137.1 ABC-2 type transport system permease protein [Micromonospora sp. Llam0]